MNKIIKIFKKIFIPNIQNDYKPYFFREISIISILIIVIILLSVSIGTELYIKKTNMTSAVLPAVLIDITNEARISNGVLSLAKNSLLDNAAQLKAQDMAMNGYFAHTSPTGITPWFWFNKVGYYFIYAGENLAVDFTESINVENAWLNSPTHKANILSNRFTEIGIATAEGYRNGRSTIYVVQMFGTPALAMAKEIPKEIKDNNFPLVIPKTESVKKTTVLPATVAIAPIVKGEAIVMEQELEIISENTKFISVKNTMAGEEIIPKESTENTKYSTWQQRLIFIFPFYTERAYKIFIWIILIALILMTVIEIRRQHSKNIMYGILLLIIIFSFIFINKTIFLTALLV